jgi:hypothetical protein
MFFSHLDDLFKFINIKFFLNINFRLSLEENSLLFKYSSSFYPYQLNTQWICEILILIKMLVFKLFVLFLLYVLHALVLVKKVIIRRLSSNKDNVTKKYNICRCSRSRSKNHRLLSMIFKIRKNEE